MLLTVEERLRLAAYKDRAQPTLGNHTAFKYQELLIHATRVYHLHTHKEPKQNLAGALFEPPQPLTSQSRRKRQYLNAWVHSYNPLDPVKGMCSQGA
jgi:hypothetical protein